MGQDAAFDHGREQMKLLAGLEVATKSVERVAESIGADLARCEQQEIDRAVQLDLPILVSHGRHRRARGEERNRRSQRQDRRPARAYPREAKLSCVFPQTAADEDGFPIRDPASSTYTGAIESAEQFGRRLYVEAWKRGWSHAEKKVVLGDRAEWIWNLAQQHFPGALQIVDLYHARPHLWEIARLLPPTDTKRRNVWIGLHPKRWLDKGKIDKLVASLRAISSPNPELTKKIRNVADYFGNNAKLEAVFAALCYEQGRFLSCRNIF
ncbi:MAG: transposase [Bryobacterales bacterium]|nr:transposase [Bryobacterales bacterium]